MRPMVTRAPKSVDPAAPEWPSATGHDDAAEVADCVGENSTIPSPPSTTSVATSCEPRKRWYTLSVRRAPATGITAAGQRQTGEQPGDQAAQGEAPETPARDGRWLPTHPP